MEDFIDISQSRHSWAWKCFKKDKKSERALCNFCGVLLDCKHGTHGMLTHLKGTHSIVDISQIPDLTADNNIITNQIVDFKNDNNKSRFEENFVEEKIANDDDIKSEHSDDINDEILESGNDDDDGDQVQKTITIEHLSAILETHSELVDLLGQDPNVQRGLIARQKIESALQSYMEMSSENSDLNNIEA